LLIDGREHFTGSDASCVLKIRSPGIEQRRDLASAAFNESAVLRRSFGAEKLSWAPTGAQKLIKSLTGFCRLKALDEHVRFHLSSSELLAQIATLPNNRYA